MKRSLMVLAVLALLFAGACGSDDDSSDGAGADVEADADVDANVDADVDFASKECQEVLKAMSEATGGLPQAMTGQKETFENAVEQFEAYADKAPKEIRGDMRVLAAAYAEVAEVLVDIDFDPGSGKTPSAEDMDRLQSLGEKFDEAEVQEASENVNAYFSKRCGTN